MPSGNNNAILYALAQQVTGLHYERDDVIAILDAEDWSGYWPVIDSEGLLTGDVVDAEDSGNDAYECIDDMVMLQLI